MQVNTSMQLKSKVGVTYLDYVIKNSAISAHIQTSGTGTGLCKSEHPPLIMLGFKLEVDQHEKENSRRTNESRIRS